MIRIGFLLSPGVSVMSFAAFSVFETANMTTQGKRYELHFMSADGGPIVSAAGMEIATKACSKRDFDTLVVTGSASLEEPPKRLVSFVKKAAPKTRRVASICTGAFTLAEAGLLDGRKATTHWHFARELQTRCPKTKVEEDRIFINDGPIWTSAGMSAGIDLALALVEEDLGSDAARTIARKLVVYHRRAGGQSQFSTLLELEPKSDRVQSALTYAKRNLHLPLGVEDLAEAACLSPRQFSRVFHAETGQSPAKAIENLRLEAARLMMEGSRHSIDEVARETGFADPDRMRRAFLRAYGQPPQVIRRNAMQADA